MPRPVPDLAPDARLRAEVVAFIRGGNAHVPLDAALDGIDAGRVNERPDGGHSLWEVVYHLWFTQRDILTFTLNDGYEPQDWPDAYWPDSEATPDEWAETCRSLLDDLDRLVALVEDPDRDLFAEFDHAPGYTLLRQALLAADHNAYHVGALIAIRRRLGLWGR